MSETKENQTGEEPSEEKVETSPSVSGVEEEVNSNPKNPSQETPKNKTTIMYGTRKLHPGSKSASAKSLKQLRGPKDDDDLLEMDDLVVKSTAPAHLIESDGPNPKRRRNRDQNRDAEREGREFDDSLSTDDSEVAPYPVDDVEAEDRPERFAEVENRESSRTRGVQEFRPSKDGKRASPKKRTKASSPTKRPAASEKPKGLLGWIKSIFTSDDGEEGKSSDDKRRRPNQSRRRNNRGGQGRSRDGQGGRGDGSGSRRPRGNRRPRRRQGSPSGEQSDFNRGNRPGRRRQKPRTEGRESQSSS